MMRGMILAGAVVAMTLPSAVSAQTAPAPAAKAVVTAPPKAAAGPGATVPGKATGERCFRLPLSDVAFGTENATKAAREKLEEYAQAERVKRKWPDKPFTRSNETVSCTVYLNLGPIGTEYRCLVTTTFCQK